MQCNFQITVIIFRTQTYNIQKQEETETLRNFPNLGPNSWGTSKNKNKSQTNFHSQLYNKNFETYVAQAAFGFRAIIINPADMVS